MTPAVDLAIDELIAQQEQYAFQCRISAAKASARGDDQAARMWVHNAEQHEEWARELRA